MTDVIRQPQNARSARTRLAILDAAWRLFQEAGPEGTTMAAVAEAAGISRRGLYLHFPSRADLLIGVVIYSDELLDLAASHRPVYQAPDSETALGEWARHIVDYHSQIRPHLVALDRARTTDADAQTVWWTAMAAWWEGCKMLAEWLAREGRLAEEWTVPEAADAMWSLMIGFNDMWRALVEERGWSRDRFLDFFSGLYQATFVG